MDLHAEKHFLNLVRSSQIWIIITFFRWIWNQIHRKSLIYYEWIQTNQKNSIFHNILLFLTNITIGEIPWVFPNGRSVIIKHFFKKVFTSPRGKTLGQLRQKKIDMFLIAPNGLNYILHAFHMIIRMKSDIFLENVLKLNKKKSKSIWSPTAASFFGSHWEIHFCF